MLFKSGVAAAISLAIFPSHAAINGCVESDQEKVTHVYFANGILTEPEAADFAVIDLQSAYKSELESASEDETFRFTKAYNQTQGALTDIVQVLQQKQNELGVVDEGLSAYQVYQWVQAGLSVEEIRELIGSMSTLVSPTTLSEAITDENLEALSDTMLSAAADAMADRAQVNANHVGYYEADLLSGKRVIVVAHSQGNLFTNQALSDVAVRNYELSQSIGSVGVASPAGTTVGSNDYTTAHDDRVIDGLRLISNVLPSNIENDPGVFNDFRSFTNHYFEQDYFDDRLPSRDVIDSEVLRLAESLPYPQTEAGEGAIRASLTWGAQPDVDLHAFEPNGSHVYYRDKVGQDGSLDVDDTMSYGPENYVVPCEDVNLGTYEIAVNYFSGYGTATAKIALFLGDGRSITPKEVSLAEPQGTVGNTNPMTVFQVTVDQNDDGEVTYTVN